jgi:hypothetical protein
VHLHTVADRCALKNEAPRIDDASFADFHNSLAFP